MPNATAGYSRAQPGTAMPNQETWQTCPGLQPRGDANRRVGPEEADALTAED